MVYIHFDKNNEAISIGDLVIVAEPTASDLHQHSFIGEVKDFRGENVIVVDGEGDCFELEPEKLEVQDSE